MGNKAYIIFTDEKEKDISPAIYLHWNGGAESVYAFLAELDRRQVRGCSVDYEAARFCQIVGEFFDGKDKLTSLSLGVMNGPKKITAKSLAPFDEWDNGVFIVSRKRDALGKPFTSMKRFHKGHFLTPLQVESEKRKALSHDYNVGEHTIAKTFEELTIGKTVEGV
jgi:hypothetical protein